MHHLGRLSDTSADPGVYASRSRGLERRPILDRAAGSVHHEVVVAEFAPGGLVDRHLHAYEEAFYVLAGQIVLDVAGATEELATDDYGFIDRGIAHALRNESEQPARWLEASAPQPGAAIEDTVFVADEGPPAGADPPYWTKHFDVGAMPEPSGGIGLAGFEGANVGGAAAEVIVGPATGASQLNLMVVRYGPGGFIAEHDHAFDLGQHRLDERRDPSPGDGGPDGDHLESPPVGDGAAPPRGANPVGGAGDVAGAAGPRCAGCGRQGRFVRHETLSRCVGRLRRRPAVQRRVRPRSQAPPS